MDAYINKCDTAFLTGDEIDVIADAVEKLTFGKILELDNTALTIRCIEVGNGYSDRIIHCRNRDTAYRIIDVTENTAMGDIYRFFNRSITDDEAPKYQTTTWGEVDKVGMIVYSTAMKIDFGQIFILCATDRCDTIDEICKGLYELSLVITSVLTPRDDAAAVLADVLQKERPKNINETEYSSILSFLSGRI